MADTKISALPASTTPLAGTEVLPIVQSGATKQVSVANLTAGRAISATAVTASTGNFIVGTSGQGIDFSATPGTGTSELLDDYEEGTWTPTIALATPGTSVSSNATGKYTKVGNLVTAVGRITLTKGTGTGDLTLGGLPFAAVTLAAYQCAAAISTDDFGVVGKIYQILLTSNSTAPLFLAISQINGAAAIASASDISGASMGVRYAISYQIE